MRVRGHRPRTPFRDVARRSVDVRPARAVRRATARDVRVLDRIHVDRRAVGVVRPARRPLDEAAVERRRVVGLDRAEVAARRRRRRAPCAGSGSAPRRGRGRPRRARARRRDGRSAAPSAPCRRSPSATAAAAAGREARPGSRGATTRRSSASPAPSRCARSCRGTDAARSSLTLTSARGAIRAPRRGRWPSSPVGAGRLEPPASRSQSGRSTRLSYAPRRHRVAG